MIALLLACAPPDAFLGTLVDGRTGAPLTGHVVRAEHEESACLRLSLPTAPDGAFRIESPCAGPYRLAPIDEGWWAPAGTWSLASPTVTAWRAPVSDGLYRLSGMDLLALTTNTTLTTTTTAGTEPVRYPLVLPAAPPVLGRGDVVVLSGPSASAWSIAPLLPAADPRSEAVPWFKLGPAIVIQSKDISSEERFIRYLTMDTLQVGLYVLASPDGVRAVIFDASGV